MMFAGLFLLILCLGTLQISEASYAKEQLQMHNSYRSRHGAYPLKLDNSMTRSATNYAKDLARRECWGGCHSSRSARNYAGENLKTCCHSASYPSCDEATKDW